MKIKSKKILLAIVLMLTTFTAWADEGGFRYKHIDINAVISADDTWDITETFVLDFTDPRHGYYRYIPEVFYLMRERPDCSVPQRLRFVCDVSDINVQGASYDTDYKDGNAVIKIGDPDRLVTGQQTYVIRYKFHYPNDRDDRYDEIFHTFLNSKINEDIDSLSFTIKSEKPLPADFDSLLHVYSGDFQDKGNPANIHVKYHDGIITGYGTNINPNTAVTIYAQLPEGFFDNPQTVSSIPSTIFFYISLILIIIVIFYEIVTRHPQSVRDVQYFPPEDMSSAEVGTIIDTSVDIVDIASLIPWLGSKGYICIKDLNAETKKKARLEVTKLKDLPNDAPDYLKRMYALLFSDDNSVVLDEMKNDPDKIKNIKKAIQKLYTGDKELTRTHNVAWCLLALAITASLSLMCSTNEETFDIDMFFLTAFTYFTPFVITWFLSYAVACNPMIGKFYRYVIPVAELVVMLFVLVLFVSSWIRYGYFLDTVQTAILFGGSFIATVFAGRLTRNTMWRTEQMGKLLGLKEFIELAEKPRLEELVESDKQYFYKILPYAMVFGLAEKWADKFKDITIEECYWYSGRGMQTGYMLASTISHSVLSSTESSIQSISVSSSSGGGGGGFAGGGGGGGGGGSW